MPASEAPTKPFRAPTVATQWVVVLLVLLLCIALSFFEGEARGWVTGLSIGVIGLFILMAWPLRKQGWFWAVVAASIAVHATAVFLLDWSWVVTQRSGLKVLGALVFPDLAVMFGATRGIYRLKYGKPAQPIEPSIDDLPRYTDRDLGF